MDTKIFKFKVNGDERGSLISLEEYKNIPFRFKRIYYIFGSEKNTIRGKHAHKNLKQVLICVNGNCKILLDDGNKKDILELNSPDIGLYIGKNIWREMYDFSKDCVLIVLADKYYDEKEYIRDYSEFKKILKNEK